jgi:hypothetical protein
MIRVPGGCPALARKSSNYKPVQPGTSMNSRSFARNFGTKIAPAYWGNPMGQMKKSILAAAVLFIAVILTGCSGSVGVGYRYYDPGYRDYHVWGPGEGVYYNQWLVETHHPHREFRRLRREDQRNYWQWRYHRH